jgi:hypothetical protein
MGESSGSTGKEPSAANSDMVKEINHHAGFHRAYDSRSQRTSSRADTDY